MGRSHAEAYELIRSRDDSTLTFGQFLRELAALHREDIAATERTPRLHYAACTIFAFTNSSAP